MGMSLRILALWAGMTAAIVVIGFNGGAWASFILMAWLVGSLYTYVFSVRVHPNRNCWSCRGSGQHGGLLFDYSRRPCARCKGTGTKPRWGRRVLRIGE